MSGDLGVLLLLFSSLAIQVTGSVTIKAYTKDGEFQLGQDGLDIGDSALFVCHTEEDPSGGVFNYTWRCGGGPCDRMAGVLAVKQNELLVVLQRRSQEYSCEVSYGNFTRDSVNVSAQGTVVLTSNNVVFQRRTIISNITSLEQRGGSPALRELECSAKRSRRTRAVQFFSEDVGGSNQTVQTTLDGRVYQRVVNVSVVKLVFNTSGEREDGIYFCYRNNRHYIYIFTTFQSPDIGVSLDNFTLTNKELTFLVTPPLNTTVEWYIVGFEVIHQDTSLPIPLENEHYPGSRREFLFDATMFVNGSRYEMKVWTVSNGRIAQNPVKKTFTYPTSIDISTTSVPPVSPSISTTSTTLLPSTTTLPPTTTSTTTSTTLPPTTSTLPGTDTVDVVPYIAGAGGVILTMLIMVMLIVIIVLMVAIHRTKQKVDPKMTVHYHRREGDHPGEDGGTSDQTDDVYTYEEPVEPTSVTKGTKSDAQYKSLNSVLSPNEYDCINAATTVKDSRDGTDRGYDQPDVVTSGYDQPDVVTSGYDQPDVVTSGHDLQNKVKSGNLEGVTREYDHLNGVVGGAAVVIVNKHTGRENVCRKSRPNTIGGSPKDPSEISKSQSTDTMYAQPDMSKKTNRRKSAPILDMQETPSESSGNTSKVQVPKQQQQQQQQQQGEEEDTSKLAMKEVVYDLPVKDTSGKSPTDDINHQYRLLCSDEGYYNSTSEQQNGLHEATAVLDKQENLKRSENSGNTHKVQVPEQQQQQWEEEDTSKLATKEVVYDLPLRGTSGKSPTGDINHQYRLLCSDEDYYNFPSEQQNGLREVTAINT